MLIPELSRGSDINELASHQQAKDKTLVRKIAMALKRSEGLMQRRRR
jgi:hypothetical protein